MLHLCKYGTNKFKEKEHQSTLDSIKDLPRARADEAAAIGGDRR